MPKIKLKNISLSYPVYGSDARSLKTSVLHIATGGRLDRDSRRVKVEALKDISLELHKGDRLALFGHNGAGKSSLLRVLAQIYSPTEGTLEIEGETNCLFDIMLGMDLELNAYANIKIRGIMMGLSTQAIRELTPCIEEFSELGDFMKMPIKTYSAGMRVRLAFAIATSIPSEILLIDEVINAGDAAFMQKAHQRMKNLVHKSDILVLSTHDHLIAREFCNKALWLERGQIKHMGDIDQVLKLLPHFKPEN